MNGVFLLLAIVLGAGFMALFSYAIFDNFHNKNDDYSPKITLAPRQDQE